MLKKYIAHLFIHPNIVLLSVTSYHITQAKRGIKLKQGNKGIQNDKFFQTKS